MRSRFAIAAVAMLIATAALAQQSKNEFSIFATNPGGGWSESRGTEWTGGGSLALNHFWSPRFSTLASVGFEHYYAQYGVYNPNTGRNDSFRKSYTTNPVDVIGQYHFLTDSRWKPYVGAGFRYVHRPNGITTGTALAPELNGGVSLLLTPHFGLAFDARYSTARSVTWNPSFKPSLGFIWRF